MSDSSRGFLRANILFAVALYAIFALGLLAGLLTFAAPVLGFENPMENPYSAGYNIMTVSMELIAVAGPGIVFLLMRSGRPAARGLRLAFRPSALLAVPAALAGYLLVNGILSVWMAFLTQMGLGQDVGAAIPTQMSQMPWVILVLGIAPALCEEFLFRGLIMPAYERHFRSPVAGVVLCALVFGLMHGLVSGAPAHILLGVVMGAIVVLTDSIWTGVLYHFTHNAFSMALAFNIGQTGAADAAAALSETPWMMAAGGFLYIAVGALLLGGIMAVFWALYRRRARRGAVSGVAEQAVFHPALPYGRRRGGFLPWLPLVIALPLILIQYGASLFVMILGGQ